MTKRKDRPKDWAFRRMNWVVEFSHRGGTYHPDRVDPEVRLRVCGVGGRVHTALRPIQGGRNGLMYWLVGSRNGVLEADTL